MVLKVADVVVGVVVFVVSVVLCCVLGESPSGHQSENHYRVNSIGLVLFLASFSESFSESESKSESERESMSKSESESESESILKK